ncbi:effector-associated domain 2-containing protein [Streptomyces humi]
MPSDRPPGPHIDPLHLSPSLWRLVDALLAYPRMTDATQREILLGMMRPEMVNMISRYRSPRVDLFSIVRTAQDYGMLQELFEAMVLIDSDPIRRLALEQALYSPANSDEHGTESE